MVDISEHYKTLGSLIRVKRKQRDLSQTQVGEVVGITKSMVSKWERGEFLENAGISKIAKLSKLLDIDPLLFLYDPKNVELDEYISVLRDYLDNSEFASSKLSDKELLRLVAEALNIE